MKMKGFVKVLNPTLTYIFLHWMGTKFSSKNIKNFFSNPPTFGECGECKVVGVDFSQT